MLVSQIFVFAVEFIFIIQISEGSRLKNVMDKISIDVIKELKELVHDNPFYTVVILSQARTTDFLRKGLSIEVNEGSLVKTTTEKPVNKDQHTNTAYKDMMKFSKKAYELLRKNKKGSKKACKVACKIATKSVCKKSNKCPKKKKKKIENKCISTCKSELDD